MYKILLVSTVLLSVAVPMRAANLNAYLMGCSITDQLMATPDLALSKGDNLAITKYTIPGCGMHCLFYFDSLNDFSEMNSLPSRPFDCLVACGFSNGAALGVANDAKYMAAYYDKERIANPSCKLYAWAQYPDTRATASWEQSWHRPATSLTDAIYGTAAYQENLLTVLRTRYPNNEVYMVPIGHAMDAFEHAARNGDIPGFTGAYDLYRDEIHLNANGSYLQELTLYATIYKKDPRGAGTVYGGNTVSAAFASKVQEIVWQVVQQYRGQVLETSGTATRVTPQVLSATLRTNMTALWFALDGRMVSRLASDGRLSAQGVLSTPCGTLSLPAGAQPVAERR